MSDNEVTDLGTVDCGSLPNVETITPPPHTAEGTSINHLLSLRPSHSLTHLHDVPVLSKISFCQSTPCILNTTTT